MIKTNLTPNEIVGFENMPILVAHLQICFSKTNAGEFPHKRLDKEIGARNREMVIKVLGELHENGFFPLSVDERGKIRWGIVTKSEGQELFEKDLPKYEKMPLEQLQRMGRAGYVEFRKSVNVKPFKGYGLSRDEIIGGTDGLKN